MGRQKKIIEEKSWVTLDESRIVICCIDCKFFVNIPIIHPICGGANKLNNHSSSIGKR